MTGPIGAILVFVLGVAASGLGGAVSGMLLGGRSIGHELSAMVGAFYGLMAGVIGMAAGLVLRLVLP